MLYHIAEMKDVFFMVRRQNYLPEKTTAILKKAKILSFGDKRQQHITPNHGHKLANYNYKLLISN